MRDLLITEAVSTGGFWVKLMRVDVEEDGFGEEVFVEEAVPDAGADFCGGCGLVEVDEVGGGERGFEGGEALEFGFHGVERAAEDGPLDEGAQVVEPVPVWEFWKVVGTDDEGDVGFGIFASELGDGVDGVAGSGTEGFARVDDARGIFAECFAEHGEAVVRFSAGGRAVFMRVPVGWDDADLAERESLDKRFEHRNMAVVDGIEGPAENDDGMG
jgi:hypothetical protein